MRETEKLFKGTDLVIPEGINKNTAVEISEYPSKYENNTMLFITKKAKGESRHIVPGSCAPIAVVCERDEDVSAFNCPIIYTENARRTLATVYSNYFGIDYSKFKIVAVTGTNGKSSVCKMLEHILTQTGASVGLIGTAVISINGERISDSFYSMTTPDPRVLYSSIKKMEEAGCNYIIMEASSHALKLGKLEPILFDIGIFTNLAHDHADFHESTEDYFCTKASLFSKCKTGIFNLDDTYSRRCYGSVKCEKISVGVLNAADAYATDITSRGLDGSEYFYRERGIIFKMPLRLPGAFNVYNSLMALKCSIKLGIKPCAAKAALSTLTCIEGRMEVIRGDVTAVIDYAHTPEAFKNTVETLKSFVKPKQNLIIVFGCGGERDRTKRPLIGRICAEGASSLVITEDNSRGEEPNEIFRDITSALPEGCDYTVIPDREVAIRKAILSANAGDVVAVIGKGHEKYIIDKNGSRYFDEKAIIHSALKAREVMLCK